MIKKIQQVCSKRAARTHLPSGFRASSSVVEHLHGHHLFGRLIQAFGHLTEDATAHQLQHTVLTRIAGENIADFKWDGEKKRLSSHHQLWGPTVRSCDTQWWHLTTYKPKHVFIRHLNLFTSILRHLYSFTINVNYNQNDMKNENTFNLKHLSSPSRTLYRVRSTKTHTRQQEALYNIGEESEGFSSDNSLAVLHQSTLLWRPSWICFEQLNPD